MLEEVLATLKDVCSDVILVQASVYQVLMTSLSKRRFTWVFCMSNDDCHRETTFYIKQLLTTELLNMTFTATIDNKY